MPRRVFVQPHRLHEPEKRLMGYVARCACGWWEVSGSVNGAHHLARHHLDTVALMVLGDIELDEITSEGEPYLRS